MDLSSKSPVNVRQRACQIPSGKCSSNTKWPAGKTHRAAFALVTASWHEYQRSQATYSSGLECVELEPGMEVTPKKDAKRMPFTEYTPCKDNLPPTQNATESQKACHDGEMAERHPKKRWHRRGSQGRKAKKKKAASAKAEENQSVAESSGRVDNASDIATVASVSHDALFTAASLATDGESDEEEDMEGGGFSLSDLM